MRCFSFIFVEFCTIFVTFSNALDWENRLVLETFNTKPSTNMVVATLPLKMTFCKLASIADGKTKEQLMRTLNLEDDKKVGVFYSSVLEMLKNIKSSDLILLNKLYVNYSSEVNSAFLTNASSSYGVNVDFIGFNMPKTAFSFINNGIASATFRRIRDVVEHNDITDQTKMMIIIAAHLRATWENPFDAKLTRNRKFYHLNNKVSEIPMMVREDSYELYEHKNYKVLTKRLISPGAAVTLVVPIPPFNLTGLLAVLKTNPDLMKEARAAMRMQLRKLVMPRIKIKSYLDLTDNLRNSTVNEILNSNSSGLDAILKEKFRNSTNMFISKIKQKLFIEVDELGYSRHAMSPQEQSWVGRPKEPMSPREIALDRPFYFTIDLQEFIPSVERLTRINHLLFAGVYYGPE